MKAMNKVASHINDMQKIHEEFGAVFDQLITEQSGDKKEVSGPQDLSGLVELYGHRRWIRCGNVTAVHLSQVADLSMGDLLLHATVAWLNPPSSLGKWKKEPQLATFGTFPRPGHALVGSNRPQNQCFSFSIPDRVPFFPFCVAVFKTAVVFVCKDGSKQKKKLVSSSSVCQEPSS